MISTDVTVVIRAAGERTEALCRQLVAEQLPAEHIFLIHEKPFARAVHRNFEIGIREGRRWTLALDADVLLAANAIRDLVAGAESLPAGIAEKVYVYQGKVYCKVFGKSREAGLHLYQTKHLPTALKLVDPEGGEVRPESATYLPMRKRGFHHVKNNHCYGLHDFYQDYSSLYRNGFFQARKHLTMATDLLHYWVEQTGGEEQQEFRVLLAGWNHSLLSWHEKTIHRVDIDEFQRLTDREFRHLNLAEKLPLQKENRTVVDRDIYNYCQNGDRKLMHRCDGRPLLSLDVRLVRGVGAGLNSVHNWLKQYGR